jgi:hypothetical protein
VEARFRVGQKAKIGEIEGRIAAVNMASVQVVSEAGTTWEVPYLAFIEGPVGSSAD